MYRPYHLCHLETPKAIRLAVAGTPLLPFTEKCCEVYTYAKRDLKAGEKIEHAIGSSEVYGRVKPIAPDHIPIVLLESLATLKADIAQGQALTWDDLDLSSSNLLNYWKEQEQL